MTITLVVSDFELPEAVQRGAQTIVDDPVDVSPGYSGRNQYIRKSSRRPRSFSIGYGLRDKADRQAIYDGYMVLGQLTCFTFRDPMDYQISAQVIGTGDGTNRSFLAKKTYSDGAGGTYDRRITRPVAAGLVVTVDDVVSADYTLNPLGEVLFNSGHAPAAGKLVKIAAAEFLCVVRYAGKLAFRMDTLLKVSVPTATLMEEFEV